MITLGPPCELVMLVDKINCALSKLCFKNSIFSTAETSTFRLCVKKNLK